ncbi:hypothetical protein ACGF5T_13490 [Streptomyces sp. NPDC047853]|uniref:hypothetical protein n=1 Tax=unclassified Streptomyces TaxID=2593676 RepID=UPI003451C60B
MGRRQVDQPSTGRQVGAGVALVVIDLVVIGWTVYSYGMAGWADGYESDGAGPSSASRVASEAALLLGGGAVVTGGGLLALGWRVPGVVQLVVLGGAALLFSVGG